MKFRIFQPTKNAMQSGKVNSKKWLMVPIAEDNIRSIDPIMGWTSAADISTQLNYEFSTKEDAVKFAEESNFEYAVEESTVATIKKKSYAENFTK
jgi:hypothetical protein